MRPQIHALALQPEIRPPDTLRAHPLPLQHARLLRLRIFTVLPLLIPDPAIRNRMHDMDSLGTELARQRLRQLPHRRTPRPVGCEFGRAAERAEGAGEDEGAFLRRVRGAQVRVVVVAAVVVEEAGEGELGEGEGAADVGGQAGHEAVVRLLHERLLGRVFDVVDGQLELEVAEGWVLLDGAEGLFQRVGMRVGGEGFDGGAWR